MLTSAERSMILQALQEWAKFAPDEPVLGFIQSEGLKTPKEILVEVIEKTSDGEALMEILEHGVRRQGLLAVVTRLRNQPQSDQEILRWENS
jgi:hypothetical protein